MSKSEIFKLAWGLAREGALTYGGSKKEYFAEALRITYKQFKHACRVYPGTRKSWAARIYGTSKRYGFNRDFRFRGSDVYDAEDGLWDIKIGSYRSYYLIKNGQMHEISDETAKVLAEKLELEKGKAAA